MQIRKASRVVSFLSVVSPILLLLHFLSASANEMPSASSHFRQAATQPSDRRSVVEFVPLTEFRVDDDALRVMATHILATGKNWRALRMVGQIILPSNSSPVTATLLLQGQNQGILKVSQSTGLSAIAIDGLAQKSVYADGTTIIDSYGAGVAALLPFHLLHSTSIIESVVAAKLVRNSDVDGILCNKLSVRMAPGFDKPRSSSRQNSTQVDFYFDPKTHLIRQTVVPLNIPGFASPLLQVTSYSDYRTSEGVTVPWHFIQTVNGTLVWEFSASSLTNPASIPNTEFTK